MGILQLINWCSPILSVLSVLITKTDWVHHRALWLHEWFAVKISRLGKLEPRDGLLTVLSRGLVANFQPGAVSYLQNRAVECQQAEITATLGGYWIRYADGTALYINVYKVQWLNKPELL